MPYLFGVVLGFNRIVGHRALGAFDLQRSGLLGARLLGPSLRSRGGGRSLLDGSRGSGLGNGGSGLVGGRLGSLGLLRLLGLLIADAQDLEDRVLLAMALLAAVIVPAALLEDDDLVGLRLGDDLGRDRQAVGGAKLRAFACEQDIAQRNGVAGRSGQLLDDDLVSGGDAILLAARAHDCEHGSLL